jgi:transcriptional regulator with XRE-family HTH domain
MAKVNEVTLGASLKQHRVSRGLSVRTAATLAGIAPMYLSLLERDACGPPSDEKLQRLAEVLGEQHAETLFAKAGRVTPQVANTILRHPTQWSQLIEAGKNLDAEPLDLLKEIILDPSAGTGGFLIEALSYARERMTSGRRTMEKKAKEKGREHVAKRTSHLGSGVRKSTSGC